jgi:hypothetical protein
MNHQPSGCCDFSKIYNPKKAIITYTNLDTKEQEYHTIKRTEIVDDTGIKIFTYILPLPFNKK